MSADGFARLAVRAEMAKQNEKWFSISTTRADGEGKQAIEVRIHATEGQMRGVIDILKNLAVEHDIRFGVPGDGPACMSNAYVWSKHDPHAGLRIRRMDDTEMVGLAGLNRGGEEIYQ
jgi:hypothetical protein